MQKQKVIMKIESYSSKDGTLLLSVEDWSVRTAIKSLVELCEKKHGNYIKLEMSPPYKPRSTDIGGQNRHIWGHLQQIANETGNDIDDVEDYIKQRALRRGYPTKQNKMSGEIKPASMKGINTVEANYLIDELHQLASELGIELDEGGIMTKKEFNLAVCKEIKQELKSRKIPYKAVAPELNISLSNFENKINLCGSLFSFYEIAKLARFLEMEIEFFLPAEY